MHHFVKFSSAPGFALASSSGCLASRLVLRGLDASLLVLAMSRVFPISTFGLGLAPAGVSVDVHQAHWEAQGQVQPRLGYRGLVWTQDCLRGKIII